MLTQRKQISYRKYSRVSKNPRAIEVVLDYKHRVYREGTIPEKQRQKYATSLRLSNTNPPVPNYRKFILDGYLFYGFGERYYRRATKSMSAWELA